jgi:hypothetical protein
VTSVAATSVLEISFSTCIHERDVEVGVVGEEEGSYANNGAEVRGECCVPRNRRPCVKDVHVCQ